MSAASPCLNPARCAGAKSHRAGSAAASACRAAGARPGVSSVPGPAPSSPMTAERDQRQVHASAHAELIAAMSREWKDLPARGRNAAGRHKAELKAALAAGDPSGWSPGCGRAHPVGGYHDRVVMVGKGLTSITYHDAQGRLHREGGPARAILSLTRAGVGVEETSWHRDGQIHREDGPAWAWARVEALPRFYLDGNEIEERPQARTSGDTLLVHWGSHLEAGASRAEATRWTAVGSATDDHDLAAHLREAGADAHLCAGAAAAGITDAATLSEIGHGRLPLSWAAAGL